MKMDWTKQHENYLKEWYGKKSVKEIADTLGRSYDSVQRKAQRMKITVPKETESRLWTQEEIDYLEKWYEKRGTDFIAKNLNRTKYSVRRKAQTLGYNSYVCAELYVKTVANCFNCDSSVINRWIDKYDLSYKTVKRGKNTCKLIDVKTFWKWAENHKDIIPWQKYESQSMLPEPKWLKETIRNNKTKNNRKPITSIDKIRVCNMRNKGKTFEEIAIELNRTVNSVKHIWKERNEVQI